MLDDAAIERYSRQILLPEVGGRGQERLCAASAIVTGSGAAAAWAASLLRAAGMRVVCEDGPAGRLTTRIGAITVAGRTDGSRAVVATLVGRPCPECVPATIWHTGDVLVADDQGPAPRVGVDASAQAFGALIAAESVRAALGLATTGRVHAFDLAGGTFAARTIPATGGCAACMVPA